MRSDERLREDICERLMLADSIDSSEVTITVKDGQVTLEGSVPNRRMKHSIEDLVDAAPGVQDIENRRTLARLVERDQQGVLNVEVLKRGLPHQRRWLGAHTVCAFGRQYEECLHLSPRRVVADGDLG